MSKNFKFLQLFGRLNELVSQKERKTQQIFLPKSNHIAYICIVDCVVTEYTVLLIYIVEERFPFKNPHDITGVVNAIVVLSILLKIPQYDIYWTLRALLTVFIEI